MTGFLVFLAFSSLALTLATNLLVAVHLRRRRGGASPRPPISVLKPLKGVDDGLYENLASFAAQRYPRFELVFGVADPRDPALEVVERLRREYPDVAIRVSTCAPDLGRNPKVSNLAAIARLASHAHWLISDSNTRVHPDYLAALVSELRDPRVGLVTSVIAGAGERGTGALFENLHLNSFVASAVCSAQICKTPIVIGKSMLFRSADLATVGGLEGVRDVLAEDHALGLKFRKAGFRVALSPFVVTTVNERWSVRSFLSRHLRWAQIRRRMAPLAFFTEPLLQPVWWAAAVAAAGRPALALAIALAKVSSDALVARRLRGASFPPKGLLLVPVKDLILLALWLVAAFRRRVVWRGNVLRLGAGTALVDAPGRHAKATLAHT
ncbi:MAG TPA: glycosyltransferase [Planctomycetota bacterium]|nr:glycosyltransferase [Planctomycetota bacterium]